MGLSQTLSPYIDFSGQKKSSLVSRNWLGPVGIVECVSEHIFFDSKKEHKHKQKAKETKGKRKTKETKEQKEKETVVVVSSICGKSIEI